MRTRHATSFKAALTPDLVRFDATFHGRLWTLRKRIDHRPVSRQAAHGRTSIAAADWDKARPSQVHVCPLSTHQRSGRSKPAFARPTNRLSNRVTTTTTRWTRRDTTHWTTRNRRRLTYTRTP
ncbi:hypothetical protein LSAT2_021203, partial [Lamellibrachia satsuma]